MRRRRRTRPLALLLAAYLSVGVVPGGFSLCIAADGHAAVEPSHDGEPCLREVERHHPDVEIVADELDHHPCQDVPLLEAEHWRMPDRLAPAHAGIVAAISAIAPAPDGRRHGCGGLAPPHALRLARSLRTVVLVI